MLFPPQLGCPGLLEHSVQGRGRSFRQGLAGRAIRRVGKLSLVGCHGGYGPGRVGGRQASPGRGADFAAHFLVGGELSSGGESAQVEHAIPAGIEQVAVEFVEIDGLALESGAAESEAAGEGFPIDDAAGALGEPILSALGIPEDRIDA